MAVVTTNLGAVTAYADAVAGGYTGTKAEWQALMASYATVAEEAAQSATDAETAKDAAVTAKTDAETAKTDAIAAKTAAQTAKTAAETAQGKAEDAQTAAETAQGAAEDAAQSVSASAAQIAQNTSDISVVKENLSDLESDGVAPSTEQLLSKNMTADAVPYHFRATGGNGADREYVDAVVGGTVCWNQLVEHGNFDSVSGWNAGTVSNNVLTIVHPNEGTMTLTLRRNCASMINHKYLLTCDVRCSSANSVRVRYPFLTVATTLTANIWETYTAIGEVTSTQTEVGMQMNSITNATSDYRNYMLFDLTAMFGSTIADYIYSLEQATAGAGVAFFKSLFPNDYYEYNAGELLSVSGLSEHKTVGFNQWDEEWELGYINPNTGAETADSNKIRMKNYIPVLPNTTYYKKTGTNSNGTAVQFWNVYFDENKNYIGYGNPTTGEFTTPVNCHYIRSGFETSYGTTYKNDICINLSDPSKNGTYEPYKAHSYPLDSSLTLRGIPKLSDGKMYYDGDRYLPDGKVERRYGIVDLGTLAWGYRNDTATYFYSSIDFIKYSGNWNNNPYPLLSNKYIALSRNTMLLNNVGIAIDGAIAAQTPTQIQIYDSAYTDAVTFKTAMSGVYLVYELATPTTEEATPYRQLQICDPNGTEEFVSTGIIPVGHETRYPENLRAKIEGLPWNFASLIAPTESTFTATRNYTTGALLIVNNVLYKATANIANGGTITPNTNVTATTLSEILSALAQ